MINSKQGFPMRIHVKLMTAVSSFTMAAVGSLCSAAMMHLTSNRWGCGILRGLRDLASKF